MTKDEQGYNGWANYETWNVALWIGNDEGLYETAKNFRHIPHPYQSFADDMRELGEQGGDSTIGTETPDGVAWNDSGLDHAALDEMINEL